MVEKAIPRAIASVTPASRRQRPPTRHAAPTDINSRTTAGPATPGSESRTAASDAHAISTAIATRSESQAPGIPTCAACSNVAPIIGLPGTSLGALVVMADTVSRRWSKGP